MSAAPHVTDEQKERHETQFAVDTAYRGVTATNEMTPCHQSGEQYNEESRCH